MTSRREGSRTGWFFIGMVVWENILFTGIIEELGRVRKVTRKTNTAVIDIAAKIVVSDTKIGDSISVNGVCLTVTSFDASGFTADVSDETLRLTTLGHLVSGSSVNLERAMLCNGRFGGHIVQGHVDGLGQILELDGNSGFYRLKVAIPENIRKFTAQKGSIAIDGISLTVAEDLDSAITVAVIPHTYKSTNLCGLRAGDHVNVEVDVIARYMEKQLNYTQKEVRLRELLSDLE